MLTSIVYPKIRQSNFFLLVVFEVTVGLPLQCIHRCKALREQNMNM